MTPLWHSAGQIRIGDAPPLEAGAPIPPLLRCDGSVKIAIVHDWLVTYAGAERVLAQMLRCYPQADVFTLVDFLRGSDRRFLGTHRPRTSLVQRLPFAGRAHRLYLPVMTYAVEQFDLSGYDLVISSSAAVAKGVLTGPDQLHIAYVHSPMRYAWDLQHQYLAEAGLDRGLKSHVARWMLHRLRLWDSRTANGVDRFVANSRYIARRVRKVYRREATVIHPPVEVDDFALGGAKEDFYLTASRLVPYKKVGAIVSAFTRLPGKRLIVIGDGPERRRIARLAGPNVTLLGHQPFEVLRDHMQRARAFIFAAEEDFGIAPLEAQACGTPVIAYGAGGLRETISGLGTEMPTGVLFHAQMPSAIVDAVRTFEAHEHRFDAGACRANAVRFAPERFRDAFSAFVDDAWKSWQAERSGIAESAVVPVPKRETAPPKVGAAAPGATRVRQRKAPAAARS